MHVKNRYNVVISIKTMKDILISFACLFLCTNVYCKDITISAPVGEILGQTSQIYFAGKPYKVSSFLGIPFAESTHGNGRFSKPVKKAPFAKTLNASMARLSCPQNVKWAIGLDKVPVGEDCLNLNILMSGEFSENSKKAVMIFIYGGAFQFGFQNAYISTALAVLHDVIYVTFNYRVSAYGFLASKRHGLKGNYGLWDQHMAIQWVHDNIAAFGGDPDRVTLFGESAGAASVIYQALYKGNKGLIHRVIAQSGTIGAFWSFDKHPDYLFDDLSSKSGCKRRTFQETMVCLRAVDIETSEKLIKFEADFLPTHDGEFVKYNPENVFKNQSIESDLALRNFAEVDVIIGLNSEEGLTELNALAKLIGDKLETFSYGMSKRKRKTYTEKLFENMNKTYNDVILRSVFHQYTNWSNTDDAISRRSLFLDFLMDIHYTYTVVQTADAHFQTRSSKNIYMYHFDHKPSFSLSPKWIQRADHSEEIPFVLGFPSFYMYFYGIFKADPAFDLPQNELALSRIIMKYWTQFAKTGNPNDPNDQALTQWLPYSTTNSTYIILTTDRYPLPTGSHFRNEYVSFWTEVYPGLTQLSEAIQQKKSSVACAMMTSGAVSCFEASLLLFMSLSFYCLSLHL